MYACVCVSMYVCKVFMLSILSVNLCIDECTYFVDMLLLSEFCLQHEVNVVS
jgi:hypothetical protein